MAKQIYINLPVADLAASTAFYQALGFTKNETFSDENATSVQWSDEIIVMLLKHDFYKRFIRDKQIIDAKSTSGVLLAINLESKEAVEQFAETAKQLGGDYFQIDMGVPADQMFGYEVEDLDGHHWEPVWMSPTFNPQSGGN
jgi:predicted lactoylglutathione lyase